MRINGTLNLPFLTLLFYAVINLADSIKCFSQSAYTNSDYVVTNAYDTIYGVIDNTDMWGNLKPVIRIEYINEDGKTKKKTFSPSECRFFYLLDMLYESLEINEPINTYSGTQYAKIFVKKIVDGELSLYLQEYAFYSPGVYGIANTNHVSEYFFKRRKEYWLQRAGVGKKRLIKYFNDCEDLVTEVKNNRFNKRTSLEIVEFYNSSCNQSSTAKE